ARPPFCDRDLALRPREEGRALEIYPVDDERRGSLPERRLRAKRRVVDLDRAPAELQLAVGVFAVEHGTVQEHAWVAADVPLLRRALDAAQCQLTLHETDADRADAC